MSGYKNSSIITTLIDQIISLSKMKQLL